MMQLGFRLTLAVAAILTLAACGSSEDGQDIVSASEPQMETIRGTLSYAEEIAMAPETTVTVRLLDVSKADAAASVIAETVFHKPGKPPVPFSISYDANKIEPGHRYSLKAELKEQKRLMFISDSAYPVLEGGEQPPVDIVLAHVPGGNLDRMPGKIRASNPQYVGHYRFIDGDGEFIDCEDDSSHPVAREQAVFALESEYRDVAPRYGDEVFVRISGKYVTRPSRDRRGKEDFLIVMQVEEMDASTGCP